MGHECKEMGARLALDEPRGQAGSGPRVQTQSGGWLLSSDMKGNVQGKRLVTLKQAEKSMGLSAFIGPELPLSYLSMANSAFVMANIVC